MCTLHPPYVATPPCLERPLGTHSSYPSGAAHLDINVRFVPHSSPRRTPILTACIQCGTICHSFTFDGTRHTPPTSPLVPIDRPATVEERPFPARHILSQWSARSLPSRNGAPVPRPPPTLAMERSLPKLHSPFVRTSHHASSLNLVGLLLEYPFAFPVIANRVRAL